MIKLAFIVPTAYIKDIGSRGNFTLALSHLVDLENENEYEKAIKEIGLEIILDNGLFENHTPEPLESLIKKALKIGATTFFAPDVLYDSIETKKELNKAIKLAENTGLKIGAVVQADNVDDYWKQLLEFNANPCVDLIGLSILSIPKSFEKLIGKHDVTESRINLLQWMKAKADLDGIKWKNCHLLGIGDSYQDVLYAKKFCPWVVSNDSSCAFQSGLNDRGMTGDLEVLYGKVKEKIDFNLKDVPLSKIANINILIEIIKEKIHAN